MRGGLLAGADAVRDADAAVSVARQCESGQLLAKAFDSIEAFEMANAVLRHGGLPSVYPGKQRRGAKAEDLLQFVANHSDDGVIGKPAHVFGARSGEEAAQQGAIFRGAVRKFVVHESRGQQAFAFAARNEKSKTGRERLADLATVAEANRDGRAVADGGEFRGKLWAAS